MSKQIKVDKNVLEINGDPFNFTSEYFSVAYDTNENPEVITYYDAPAGNVIGTRTFVYDGNEEITSVVLAINGNTYTETYTLDSNDNFANSTVTKT